MKRKNEKSEIENGQSEQNGVEHSDIRGDEANIALLLFLYLLQGIPLGLSSAIPMLLQNRHVSYKQQAEFSFVQWPFSLKLLWAPIVDAIFSRKFGRRKTWLIPTQYAMGLFMLTLSRHVNQWLDDSENGPNIGLLTILFFTLNVLAATQDIAVDGWALTMLKRQNVGYASTCNSVGQTAGYFLGYVLFIALESPTLCNSYLRSEPSSEGIVTLAGFLYFWGWIFIGATTLVALFKREIDEKHAESQDFFTEVKHAYQLLWRMMKLPSIKITAIILLTAKIGFSACDAVSGLKLIDAGVPKEKLTLMAVPLIPLQIFLPFIIARYTSGPRPMDIYLAAFPYKLIFGLCAAFLVWITPSFAVNGEVSMYYAAFLIILYTIHQVAATSMFVASMAFFAKISDPAVGGTYMTFLNTLSNLGGNWPATATLWFVEPLTWRQCTSDAANDCSTSIESQQCIESGGICHTILDGYYIESILCVIIGFLWLRWGEKKINFLQLRPMSSWQVVPHKS
ncbi:acetyl-coenzyme A transporter 1 [Chelonus insularis]|uniref:acetyl-coenzyme A transporter 1 n=1 Tax=Chelonus insularis TaxID=460826 RepID=UPI0015889B9F|nr:acetyl-coenzyme A transporter 1 [Chelonus insularis]XP_034949366.1 acetyl-coenzyme A transporter 1 [Chelonus insularis]